MTADSESRDTPDYFFSMPDYGFLHVEVTSDKVFGLHIFYVF